MRRSRPPSAAFNSASASPTAPDRSPRWRTPTGSSGGFFSKVTREEVGRAFLLINDRPRKVLGYRTANEACWEGLPHSA